MLGYGSMDIIKPPVPEEIMNGKSGFRANAENRAVLVRSRTKMGYAAQELVTMTLLLQWIRFGIGLSEYLEHANKHFPFLAFADGLLYGSGHCHCRTGIRLFDLPPRVGIPIDDALQVAEARTVIDFKKSAVLADSAGTDPAFQTERRRVVFRKQNVAYTSC